jgi:antitoxin (DNA-binding transcriptional repressor) of toxin-antitoxin stability system
MLAGGEEIQITRRKRVVARLLPPENRPAAKRPDFLARLRKIYGNKRLAVSGSELLSAERNRY